MNMPANQLTKNPNLKNLTRTSRSLVRKLWQERDFLNLALYGILRQSDLGREGIERSGSYRFADHVYRAKPSGKGIFGRWLDARLLNMPASRAFRRRYLRAKRAIHDEWKGHPPNKPFHLLGLPCGLPRDIVEFAHELERVPTNLHYIGMDLDAEVLSAAQRFCESAGFQQTSFHQGNALEPQDFPNTQANMVVSTGLGEFLDNEELVSLYQNVHSNLRPGGLFYTSATVKDKRSDRLMRAFELRTHYRDEHAIRRHLSVCKWQSVEIERDTTGLQVFVTARKT